MRRLPSIPVRAAMFGSAVTVVILVVVAAVAGLFWRWNSVPCQRQRLFDLSALRGRGGQRPLRRSILVGFD